MPTDIVVDAMGSDKAPDPEIRGAIMACRHLDVRVHLVGPEDIVRPALLRALRTPRPSGAKASAARISIVHSSEWISMEDKAAQAVRAKRDSSMRVGLRMVRDGHAAGFFTAGNTGAAMATAKLVLGMLAGVHRPALATVLPSTGTPATLLDVGANVDSDPDNLLQFAVMGHMYARNVLHIRNPRVGLLSIGEEDSKGNQLTRDTLPLLRARADLNFIGNVEGRDLFNGHSDVTICDGFVGNVALKSIEGLAKLVSLSLRSSLKSTITSQVGALLSRQAFADFKKRLDYTEYGGAPLLGVRGVCIIGHGSSNDRAVMNGIRVAAEFAQAEVNSGIEAALRTP